MAFEAGTIDFGAPDLREAQRGALHAVAAHFAWSRDSAQVVLPTGVGKTLVATLLPYLMRPTRMLVVVPARIVRDQVANEFATLKTAKAVGALGEDVEIPKVLRADHRLASWDAAAEYDVVVGTAQVLSRAYTGVAPIPSGLFDLVVFDEAHHLPAPTWDTLHGDVGDIPKVLLTATPFRRDRQRLPGELAFTYPLRRAISAGAYMPVRFVPVAPTEAHLRDAALAAAAAERLASDEHVAADSRLLVRTDRQEHAKDLVDVYAAAGLSVAVVLDRTAGRTVRRYLTRMEVGGDLMGLVVVGAMTEGFDFPRLKVATYHEPHRALAPTLQFVGRLARAGDVAGEVIAFAQDVSQETAMLFREDAVWETVLPDLVDTAVDDERRLRSFTSGLSTLGSERHRVSALAIAPPRSTHIFRMSQAPDFSFEPLELGGGDVIERFRHSTDQFVAWVTRRRLHPRFMRDDGLDSLEHHLHVATWISDPGLLFISTDLNSALKSIRSGVSAGAASPVGASDLSRLLAAAKLERCFSVGARPTSIGTAANESYRQYSGPRAELSLNPSDARALVLGHVMGRMTGSGSGSGTFGFSSKKAKLWEPTPTGSLADFREWCKGHADVLRTGVVAGLGNASLDYLGLPDRLMAFPDAPLIAILPAEVITGGLRMRINAQAVEPLALEVAGERVSPANVRLTLTHESETCQIELATDGSVGIVTGAVDLIDAATGEILEIADVLEDDPPTLLFGDGTWVLGVQVIHPPTQFEPLAEASRLPISWVGVDTSMEFVEPLTPTGSVAGKTLDLLAASADWVVQDHKTDELADFVTIRELPDRIDVDLVHCKKPGGQPATRVTDIQELLAQGMRSMYLATAGASIWAELAHRVEHRSYTKVLKGDKAELLAKLTSWRTSLPIISWRITCVQPGVDDAQLSTWSQGNALMVSASDVCKRQGVSFRLIDSAPST